MATAAEKLLKEIESFCNQSKMAKSTFGKMAVNDGKLCSRLSKGNDVTLKTRTKVRDFIHKHQNNSSDIDVSIDIENQPNKEKIGKLKAKSKRFYDNRQNYLSFINSTNEKWKVAQRAARELKHLKPTPPALRIFDAGMGDATILTHLLCSMHRRYPIMPFFIVAKEISLEDVRISLSKLSDRFVEHPATVIVVTNMHYAEAPWLRPNNIDLAAALNWNEVELEGECSHQYGEQIKDLDPLLVDGWKVKSSMKTGNPVYVRPSVLVIYRKDHKFLLNNVIPKPGQVYGDYDLVIASQPWRARVNAQFKAKNVLAPLTRALSSNGRLLAVQSSGGDPALELIQEIWPNEEPFLVNRYELIKALKNELGRESINYNFLAGSDIKSLIRYRMHVMSNELEDSIGTSTLFAAWNAAVYVNQIEDDRIAPVVETNEYLKITAKLLKKYNGLWFNDESFIISKKSN